MREGASKREGTYICLWLIPVDIWEKPIQYCEAIILQLKRSKEKQEKKPRDPRDVYTQRKGHVRTQQKVVICKPRRKAVEDTGPIHTLILDFQPPEL